MNPSFLDFPLYRFPEGMLPADRVEGEGRYSIGLLYECEGPESASLNPYLNKILEAVKINRAEDTKSLMLTPGEHISLQQFPAWEEVRYWLIFGIPADQLGLHLQLPPYVPTPFAGATFLWSDTLKAIWEERQQGGKQMSGQLWQSLQQLFPPSFKS